MQKVNRKHTEAILREMCTRVGQNYDTLDFTKPKWFQSITWTQQEEESFIKWLTEYLVKNRLTTKYASKREAEKLVANYGWMTAKTL